ncbi:hypothetical protein [Pseudomonas sp. dw_612]|nr:hypothetical protein [Pseudomonas sp. dw_612]
MAVINGTAGIDTLIGTNADDLINGLRGDDVLIGAAGPVSAAMPKAIR